VAFCTVHFLLSEAQCDAVDLSCVRKDLDQLDGLVQQALKLLHEEQLASDTLVLNRKLTHAVCQSTLVACEAVCSAVTDLEERLSRGTSLLHKLPGQVGQDVKLLLA
jgi:hypothetical protein